jgi:hypothetical protein
MNLCSKSHPLCTGVSFNPDMQKGYANCYPKSSYSNSAQTGSGSGQSWITHSAVATVSNITAQCKDGSAITTSNNIAFTLQCNQNRPGNDLSVYHEESLERCAETCATYTGNTCVGVLFDGKMELGWENCYLKNATGTPAYNSTATFARLTGTGAGGDEGGSEGGGSSGSSGSADSTSKPKRHSVLVPVVVVCVLVGVALIAGLAFWWWRRRARRAAAMKGQQHRIHEIDSDATVGKQTLGVPGKNGIVMVEKTQPAELSGSQVPELGNGRFSPAR